MQKLIAFCLLLGVVSAKSYGQNYGVEEGVKTAGSFFKGAAEIIEEGIDHVNPFHEHHEVAFPGYPFHEHQGENFPFHGGYPPHGGFPVQYWSSFGIHPIYGTNFCSCPAGFFDQEVPYHGEYAPGVVGTVTKTVKQTAAAPGVHEVVQETKEFVAENHHHGY